MTVTIPTSEAQYGYVVGRIIRVIGDTPSDPDDKPDALPAAGTVTFTPAAPLGIATGPSAFVLRERVTCPLDAAGELVRHDGAGTPGVALRQGVYGVSFTLETGTLPGMSIEVRAEHTQASPLDLVTAADAPIVPGTPVQTLVVPSGAAVGDVLAWGAGGVEWAAPGAASVPDATTSTKGKVRLAGDLSGTADAPTVPGLSGKANTSHTHVPADIAGTAVITTDSRLSDARTPTSHSHPASQISDSTSVGRSVVTAATAAAARTAIGAGTSNFSGAYADLTGKPTIPDSPDDIGAAPASHEHTAADIDSGAALDGHILTADGAGGAAWGAPTDGGGGSAYELRGTGMPNGVVTAAVGTYYTDTISTNGATRWYKATGTGSTGWIVVFGDTGLRRLTPPADAPEWHFSDWPDWVHSIQRYGPIVTLKLHALAITTSTTTVTVYNIPSGFRPPATVTFSRASSKMQIHISTHNVLMVKGTAGDEIGELFTWSTANAWPTTLPGTPL